jgi:hypothetical protein
MQYLCHVVLSSCYVFDAQPHIPRFWRQHSHRLNSSEVAVWLVTVQTVLHFTRGRAFLLAAKES